MSRRPTDLCTAVRALVIPSTWSLAVRRCRLGPGAGGASSSLSLLLLLLTTSTSAFVLLLVAILAPALVLSADGRREKRETEMRIASASDARHVTNVKLCQT